MHDSERLLKAIEFCRENTKCDGCPYEGDCITQYNPIENDTIAILRELEPVKPKLTGIESHYNCGNCGLPLTNRLFIYCPYCGRRIKWND